MTSVRSEEDTIVMRRYEDAYRVARTQIRIGKVAKAIGLVIAAVFLLLSLGPLLAVRTPQQSRSVFDTGTAVSGLTILASMGTALIGIAVGAVSFIVGILLSAQGQLLQAHLDTAVYASPFLSRTQQRVMLGLPAQPESPST